MEGKLLIHDIKGAAWRGSGGAVWQTGKLEGADAIQRSERRKLIKHCKHTIRH
jgi:hypothetical protein